MALDRFDADAPQTEISPIAVVLAEACAMNLSRMQVSARAELLRNGGGEMLRAIVDRLPVRHKTRVVLEHLEGEAMVYEWEQTPPAIMQPSLEPDKAYIVDVVTGAD